MIKYGSKTMAFRENESKMEELLKYHDGFRGLVAAIANHEAGVDISAEDYKPSFMYKCEGGVRVDGCELVLAQAGVYPEYGGGKETKEEKALVGALELVLGHIEKEGSPFSKGLIEAFAEIVAKLKLDNAKADALLQKIGRVGGPFGGDPWRNFFGSTWTKHVSKANDEAKKEGKDTCYF